MFNRGWPAFHAGAWDLTIFVAFAAMVSALAVVVAATAAFSIEQRRTLGKPLNITRLRMLALTSSVRAGAGTEGALGGAPRLTSAPGWVGLDALAQAFGICVGWAWYDAVAAAFNLLLPGAQGDIAVSVAFAVFITCAAMYCVGYFTASIESSRSHLVRQLFVLMSNAMALVAGYAASYPHTRERDFGRGADHAPLPHLTDCAEPARASFTWQNAFTVTVASAASAGSGMAVLLRLAVVGAVYWGGIVLRRFVRTILERATLHAADDNLRRRHKSYAALLSRMLGLLLGLAMADALHELLLRDDNGRVDIDDVLALGLYAASTVLISLTAAWWFSAKPDVKATYSKEARALAISCSGFLMGWAVRDVAHAFFVQYLTPAFPGQAGEYIVFALAVTVAGSYVLRWTLVPVDFRDDWYETVEMDDDAAPASRPGGSTVLAPVPPSVDPNPLPVLLMTGAGKPEAP